jgi:spectinomycin phosphotransferase
MLERPKLADDVIVAQLRSSYDLRSVSLEFLPVGNDARAWAYRVETACGEFYLKLRKGVVNKAALIAPQFLQSRGVENAVAPLQTASGQLFARSNEYSLMLYPYIQGESEWNMPLTWTQWRDWGGIMRSIHSATIPANLVHDIPREVFAVKWLEKLARVEKALARGEYKGEVAGAVAELWRDNSAVIELCRGRYLSLGARLERHSPEFALCHADIHSANIIIDATGFIHIVDWDETLLAPKERDLMFFIDDGRPADTTDAFMAGYCDRSVDLLGLAYYKYDWVIQELADYGERVFLSSGVSGEDLVLAQREFARLFDPNDVIERAHRAYANLLSSATQTDAK